MKARACFLLTLIWMCRFATAQSAEPNFGVYVSGLKARQDAITLSLNRIELPVRIEFLRPPESRT